jgi:hypothetical protein
MIGAMLPHLHGALRDGGVAVATRMHDGSAILHTRLMLDGDVLHTLRLAHGPVAAPRGHGLRRGVARAPGRALPRLAAIDPATLGAAAERHRLTLAMVMGGLRREADMLAWTPVGGTLLLTGGAGLLQFSRIIEVVAHWAIAGGVTVGVGAAVHLCFRALARWGMRRALRRWDTG